MKFFAKYLRQYKKQVIIGPIFKWLEAVFELIVPIVMASVIDGGINAGNQAHIWKMGGILLALGTAGLVFALICQYLASIASQGFGTNVRNALFEHINTLSYAEIDKFGSSALVTRLTNDINQMQLAVAIMIRLVVRAPFLVVGAIVMSIILNPIIALIVIASSTLIAFTYYLVMTKAVPYFKANQKKLEKLSLKTSENLEGARVVRAFAEGESEREDFKRLSRDFTKSSIRVGKINALLNPLTTIIVNAAIIAIIYLSGIKVNRGNMTQGEVVAFVNYMMQIFLAMTVIANIVFLFTKAHASMQRVKEVMQTPTSIVGAQVSLGEPNAPVAEFKNVSFSYGKEGYALKNISLKIEKGEIIGIIGGTGSGKSTLANLVPRFYDATLGEVLFQGVNVKEYDLKALRMKIGIVPQSAVLFTGTIESNLRWGKPDASEEQLLRALKIAQAMEIIKGKKDGLKEWVIQGGRNFSGGQRQRLTIARALVREPDLLILDDSASALDFATSLKLSRALKKSGITCVVISQRAEAVKRANKILVLDGGNAVGLGTHNDLFQSCDIYREICLSQTKGGAHEKV